MHNILSKGHADFFYVSYLISFVIIMLAEVKVVVVFDAAMSGQSTHTETYRG
jgi:hypothetical protein